MFVVDESPSAETSVSCLPKSTNFYHHKAVNFVKISNPTEPNHFMLNLSSILPHSIHKNAPLIWCQIKVKKVKCFRYRPGVAQRVGRGVTVLFHDRGTRRGWVVSSTPWPHFNPRERPGTHFTVGWVGPILVSCEKRKTCDSELVWHF